MNCRVAICAADIVSLRNIAACALMAGMALETEIGFTEGEEIIIYRAMRRVACAAVFGILGVFIGERAFFFAMAFRAGGFYCLFPHISCRDCSMSIMTIDAEDSFFMDGMMARKGELCFNILMALKAHLERIPGPHDQVGPGMDVMAVGAGDIIDIVRARVPVVEIEGCVCRMALEANEGFGGSGEVFEVVQGIVFTFCLYSVFLVLPDLLFGQPFDGKASRTMA